MSAYMGGITDAINNYTRLQALIYLEQNGWTKEVRAAAHRSMVEMANPRFDEPEPEPTTTKSETTFENRILKGGE